MSYNIPDELKFTKTHEWVKDLGGGKYKVGVSEYAAKHIGDVTYVELPDVDSEVETDDSNCVVETVKSSEDVYNPVRGTIIETNEDLLGETPEVVNNDCYEDGWLYVVEADSADDFNELLSASQYKEFLNSLED